jgi:hypothetical protein
MMETGMDGPLRSHSMDAGPSLSAQVFYLTQKTYIAVFEKNHCHTAFRDTFL